MNDGDAQAPHGPGQPARERVWRSGSGDPIAPLYTAAEVRPEGIGQPGEPPFTHRI